MGCLQSRQGDPNGDTPGQTTTAGGTTAGMKGWAVGDECKARWTDGHYYFARIEEVTQTVDGEVFRVNFVQYNETLDVTAADLTALPSSTPTAAATTTGDTKTTNPSLVRTLSPASDEDMPELHQAVWAGDLQRTRQLIEAGHDVNEVTAIHRISPLYLAAAHGDNTVAQILLDHEAWVDEVRDNGKTPLFVAAFNGHGETVQLLLSYKANMNQGDHKGYSPVYAAAQNGHAIVVALLADAKANLDTSARGGETPLFIACQKGHLTVVKVLLQFGASPDKCRKDGSTPLWVAAAAGHTEVVRKLLESKADKTIKGFKGLRPAQIAERQGHAEIVKLLK